VKTHKDGTSFVGIRIPFITAWEPVVAAMGYSRQHWSDCGLAFCAMSAWRKNSVLERELGYRVPV